MTQDDYIKELEHCARAVRNQSDQLSALRRIGEAMDRLIGSRMFTFLRFDLEKSEMTRLYCTQPERYPIGARKPMREGRWSQCVIDRGVTFIASGEAEMQATFSDYAALKDMGCMSTMAVPVRHRGRTLGTMNLNGAEGRYGERESELAQPFATLAIPAFLTL